MARNSAIQHNSAVPNDRSPESDLMASLPPSVTPQASVSATSVPTVSITESEENINGNNRNFERTPVIGEKSEEAGGEKTAAVREKGQETAEQPQGKSRHLLCKTAQRSNLLSGTDW